MSRIHVCCDGFKRNEHIFKKCDPICSKECVSGVCVGPNECICYPDHVKNLDDYCVPTCPVGKFYCIIFLSYFAVFFISM